MSVCIRVLFYQKKHSLEKCHERPPPRSNLCSSKPLIDSQVKVTSDQGRLPTTCVTNPHSYVFVITNVWIYGRPRHLTPISFVLRSQLISRGRDGHPRHLETSIHPYPCVRTPQRCRRVEKVFPSALQLIYIIQRGQQFITGDKLKFLSLVSFLLYK